MIAHNTRFVGPGFSGRTQKDTPIHVCLVTRYSLDKLFAWGSFRKLAQRILYPGAIGVVAHQSVHLLRSCLVLNALEHAGFVKPRKETIGLFSNCIRRAYNRRWRRNQTMISIPSNMRMMLARTMICWRMTTPIWKVHPAKDLRVQHRLSQQKNAPKIELQSIRRSHPLLMGPGGGLIPRHCVSGTQGRSFSASYHCFF